MIPLESVWPARVPGIALTIFVVLVAFFDLRERRIPNFLVFPAALLGMLLHSFLGGLGGLWFGAKGLVIGFCLLIIPYALGGMKAGDVKFLAAIGAFLGATGVLRALLLGLLFYPLQAAIAVIKEGKLRLTWLRFRQVFWNFLGFFAPSFKLWAMQLAATDDERIGSVKTPYGVALAVGSLLALYTQLLLDVIR